MNVNKNGSNLVMTSNRLPAMRRLLLPSLLSSSLLMIVASEVQAHGEKPHGAPAAGSAKAPVMEQQDWGIAGKATRSTRTIAVGMSDAMRFTPESIVVALGETVRFVVRNDGQLLHEFVIGTKAKNDEHAALMLKFPGMEHEEPYMAHVSPKQSGEIVWKFNRAGEFDFACLIAGHYQAGMIGRINVVDRRAANQSGVKQ